MREHFVTYFPVEFLLELKKIINVEEGLKRHNNGVLIISLSLMVSNLFVIEGSLPYYSLSLWLVGLGVWFSLKVRGVSGSNPGRALQPWLFSACIKRFNIVTVLFFINNRTSTPRITQKTSISLSGIYNNEFILQFRMLNYKKSQKSTKVYHQKFKKERKRKTTKSQ